MNQSTDNITEITACESIITALQSSSFFSFKKKGYVRLIRDYGRRSYVIEFFPFIKDRNPSSLKPILTANISKIELKDGKIQYKNDCRTIIISDRDGVYNIGISDAKEAKLFQEKLEKCLQDPCLIDNSLIIIEKKKLPVKKLKISNSENKSESMVKITKDDVLLSLYQSHGAVEDKKVEVLSEMKKNVSQESKENLTEPSITAKKFYANERPKSVQISEEIEVLNEPAKRSFSTPKSNLKRRRDDENTNEDKTNSKIITPKRNMLNENSKQIRTTPSMNTRAMKRLNIDNQENQENKIDEDFLKSPVKTWNRNNSKTFLKGFSNLGNTCYMNSILQCLLNIDTFSLELLKSYDKIKSLQIKEISDQNLNEDQIILLETEQNYLFNSLCELVKARELHNEDLKVKSLRDVKNTISKEATRFSGYQQHDAHEFLCQVLDQLKDEAGKMIKNGEETKISNPVVDNFEFQVSHEIECQTCGNTISNNEEYNNLCLELPEKFQNSLDNEKNISIQNALDIFFQDEVLNDFKCEKCDTKGENLIKRKFVRLPRVLILHLKRYQFKEVNEEKTYEDLLSEEITNASNIATFSLVKNESSILIPQYLELKHLLTSKTEKLKKPCPIDKDILESSLKIDDTPRPITPLKSHSSRKNFHISPNRPALGKISINSPAVRSIKSEENPRKTLFRTPEDRSRQPMMALKTNSLSKNTKFLDEIFDKDSDDKSNKKKNLRTDLSKQFDEDTRQAVKLSLAEYKAESLDFIDEKEEICSEIFEDPFEEQKPKEDKNLIIESKKTENSYRIIGIVNHLGSSSYSGHYISDVLNLRTKRWSSFDDSHVESLSEDEVFTRRVKTGYVFFYIHNSLINE